MAEIHLHHFLQRKFCSFFEKEREDNISNTPTYNLKVKVKLLSRV